VTSRVRFPAAPPRISWSRPKALASFLLRQDPINIGRLSSHQTLETLGADPEFSAMTVREWIEHHIEHLTGLRKSTLYDYRSYLENDIDEALGDLPLQTLSSR
jgi:hypothetical protein